MHNTHLIALYHANHFQPKVFILLQKQVTCKGKTHQHHAFKTQRNLFLDFLHCHCQSVLQNCNMSVSGGNGFGSHQPFTRKEVTVFEQEPSNYTSKWCQYWTSSQRILSWFRSVRVRQSFISNIHVLDISHNFRFFFYFCLEKVGMYFCFIIKVHNQLLLFSLKLASSYLVIFALV